MTLYAVPRPRTAEVSTPGVAYSAATRLPRHLGYALAAWVKGRSVTATAWAQSPMHAELFAAQLAVRAAPPGPLALWVDSGVAQLLQTPEPGAAWARWITAFQEEAAERQVSVNLRCADRGNRARLAVERQAQRVSAHPVATVRLRLGPSGVTLRGAGYHGQHPGGPHAALLALLELAQQLPAGCARRVKGVPPVARHQWPHPELAAPALRPLITQARAALHRRRIRFTLCGDGP